MRLGVGFLTWYYARALARPAQAQQAAQAAAKTHAQGEMTLPSLGRIEVPRDCSRGSPAPPKTEAPAFEQAIGPAPPPPAMRHATAMPMPVGAAAPARPQKSPGELAFERRLAGPAFARDVDGLRRRSAAALVPASAMPAGSGNAAGGERQCGSAPGPAETHGDAGGGALGSADAAVPARQGRLHRLHARDRDRFDASRA